MITTVKQTLQLLDDADITYQLYQHPPVHTVEQAKQHCQHISGAHVKNLCLRNKKKNFYCLVTVPDNKRIDLKQLSDQLGHGRLSFVNGDYLFESLGVKPGSVNPFCLLNDKNERFQFYIDASLKDSAFINVHPMDNQYTVHIHMDYLIQFLSKKRSVNFIAV